jgi:hypothetical protein
MQLSHHPGTRLRNSLSPYAQRPRMAGRPGRKMERLYGGWLSWLGCPGCGRNATVSMTQRLWPMVWWRMVKVSPVQVLFLPNLSESLWIVANRCLVPLFRALNRLWLGGHAWVSGTSLCSVDVVLPHFCWLPLRKRFPWTKCKAVATVAHFQWEKPWMVFPYRMRGSRVAIPRDCKISSRQAPNCSGT